MPNIHFGIRSGFLRNRILQVTSTKYRSVVDDDFMKSFLTQPRRIAIVGASSNPDRASNEIMKFLMERGHSIHPIHPMEKSVLGVAVTRYLKDLEQKVDAVIIYLSTRNVFPQIKVAVDKRIPLIWLPLNITSPEGRKLVESKNLVFVENRCPKIEWRRLGINPPV